MFGFEEVQPWVCEGDDAGGDTVAAHEGQLHVDIVIRGIDWTSSLVDGHRLVFVRRENDQAWRGIGWRIVDVGDCDAGTEHVHIGRGIDVSMDVNNGSHFE